MKRSGQKLLYVETRPLRYVYKTAKKPIEQLSSPNASVGDPASLKTLGPRQKHSGVTVENKFYYPFQQLNVSKINCTEISKLMGYDMVNT